MAKYQFGDIIGEGGFGDVREAIRVDDGWRCVVKFLKKDYSPQDVLRFKREVRIQAQMRHRNVVPIVGMNLADEPPWFIMPRALVNLRQYLAQSHGDNELWIFRDVATGVDYAHKNGVIHRDIKPENILIYRDSAGNLYGAVSDFGIGRLVNRDTPTLTQSNARIGTLQYVAPEQWEAPKNADARADIYSLGKVLYEILTGGLPYPTMNLSLVPRQFVYIIQKATNNDCKRRYQCVSEILDDLDLVTKHRQDFEKPTVTALQIARKLFQDQKFDSKSIEPLARFLHQNADDYQMLIQAVPRLPEPILNGLVVHHSDQFKVILEAYDAQVDGPLSFDYCDIVADFYEKVFRWTRDDNLKMLILRRLPLLGSTHNRWHVGRVFASIVSGLDDPSLIMLVRDVLAENPKVKEWCGEYLRGVSCPQPIRRLYKWRG